MSNKQINLPLARFSTNFDVNRKQRGKELVTNRKNILKRILAGKNIRVTEVKSNPGKSNLRNSYGTRGLRNPEK